MAETLAMLEVPRPHPVPAAFHQLPVPKEAVVHLWQWRVPSRSPAPCETRSLSPSEAIRAAGFRHERDRNRFLWRRTMLRDILAGYSGMSPADVAFHSGRYGKPALVGSGISFNCANCDEWIFLAATAGTSVGVDIERQRPGFDWRSIAEIAFHRAEIAWISSQADHQSGFSRIWTRREALFKAWGKGLHDSMRETCLVRDGDLAASVADADGQDWRVSELTAPDGYRAALAIATPSDVRVLAYRSREAA